MELPGAVQGTRRDGLSANHVSSRPALPSAGHLPCTIYALTRIKPRSCPTCALSDTPGRVLESTFPKRGFTHHQFINPQYDEVLCITPCDCLSLRVNSLKTHLASVPALGLKVLAEPEILGRDGVLPDLG